jgi:8-oxo-dGTP pyrophosphatase MutT (NUDIX family)
MNALCLPIQGAVSSSTSEETDDDRHRFLIDAGPCLFEEGKGQTQSLIFGVGWPQPGRSAKLSVMHGTGFGHKRVMSPNRLTASEIARRLQRGRHAEPHGEELPGSSAGSVWPAAVLVPLFRQAEAWHLLYIRRTEQASDRHSGEVAFPGGRCEPGDAGVVATALREAREEVGLDPGPVQILGSLRPFRTVSGYLVTPVVGQIPWPLPLRPDPSEVAHVFSLPLAWLGDPDNRQVRIWPSPDHPQAREVIFYEERDGQRLWGVSARITMDFLSYLG